MEHLQYPVGKHQYKPETFKSHKLDCINTIATFYNDVKTISDQLLQEDRLHVRYRPEGWKAIQVIHHVADSHMHALLRFKLALTEMEPVIKPYDEAGTALLADYETSIDIPLMIIKGVHEKWIHMLKNMSDQDFDKCYIHPQYGKRFSLWESLSLYDWHCRHHLGHLNLCLTNHQ